MPFLYCSKLKHVPLRHLVKLRPIFSVFGVAGVAAPTTCSARFSAVTHTPSLQPSVCAELECFAHPLIMAASSV